MKTQPVLYDLIGNGYNQTRQADPVIATTLRRLLSPQDGGHYLDIGCGTGNYTIALAGSGLKMTGIEPSAKMLAEAAANSSVVNWLQGTAENIPLQDTSVDGAVGTMTIHHWQDITKAFTELNRVLKADAKLVFFTTLPSQMQNFWLNHYFPNTIRRSIEPMPTLEKIISAAEAAGLSLINTETYWVQDDLKDGFLYSGKNRPEIYLDEQVRNGISSFTVWADEKEVAAGRILRSAIIIT